MHNPELIDQDAPIVDEVYHNPFEGYTIDLNDEEPDVTLEEYDGEFDPDLKPCIEFVNDAVEADIDNDAGRAYQIIFGNIDTAISRGMFEYVDEMFQIVDWTKTSVSVINAIFMATCNSSEYIPSRLAAYNKAEVFLLEKGVKASFMSIFESLK